MMTRVRAIARPLTACLPIPRPASCWRRIATRRKVITTSTTRCTPSIRKKNSRSNYTLWRQKKRHDLHGEPEPAGRLGRGFISAAVSPITGTAPGPRSSIRSATTIHLVVSPGRRARSASIRQTAPVIVATIVFHSTSATRCGLAITAPPT